MDCFFNFDYVIILFINDYCLYVFWFVSFFFFGFVFDVKDLYMNIVIFL